jgi:hypothetical protein
MREFFRGWRRKIGCVVLVIGLAEWVAIARGQVINNGVPKIEATFMIAVGVLLIVWPRKQA